MRNSIYLLTKIFSILLSNSFHIFNPSVSRVFHGRSNFDKQFARVADDEEIIINEFKKNLACNFRQHTIIQTYWHTL